VTPMYVRTSDVPVRFHGESAEELRSRYEFTPFDYVNEWPVRMGAIRESGALTHLFVQYCHVVVDGLGIEAAVRDLEHLDGEGHRRGERPATGAAPAGAGPDPGGSEGRRRSDKSLRYWESQLLGGWPMSGWRG
jgi:hypothetical protein